MTKPDLENRIADAVASPQSSGVLSDLLAEVRSAEAQARDDLALSRQLALDPATRPDALTKARKGMDDAEFAIARLQTAKAKLTELAAFARRREQAERSKADETAALKERDALAAELAEKYPRLAGELIDLLQRIDRNRAALGNRHPDAELVARGLPNNFRARVESSRHSFLDYTRLADWRGNGGNMGQLWPPAEMRRVS